MAFLKEWVWHYRNYNLNIKYAILANLLSQTGFGIFIVVYNFYIRELGYSQDVNGQIISLTSLGTALLLVPAGILSDRKGRKKMLLFGTVAAGFILFLRSIVEIESVLIAAGFLTGVFIAFSQVSAIPLLAENSTASERIHLFSLYSGVMTAAQVIGNLLGGILTDFFALFTTDLMSVRMTLIIGSFFYSAAFIPLIKLKEPKREKVKSAEKINLRSFIQTNRSGLIIIGLFAISQMMIGFGSGLVIPYLNLYFADRFSAPNSIIGFIMSLGQAATAIAMFIGPAVVKRFGEVKAVVYLQISSLPFLFLTAFTQNLLLASLGFLFRQALMNAGNPIQNSLIMSKVDDSVKGLANSVNQTVFNLGWALMGPVSTSIVMANGPYWGYAKVFSITAGLYLVASLYFLIVFKSIRTEENQEAQAKNL